MKLFISYAHADTESVLALAQAFDVHDVWYDNRLNVGQEWWNEIERQIAACHCFVFVLSPDSMASEYCQKELAVARKLQKAIAPIMVKPMDIPKDFSSLQVIDLVDGLTPANAVRVLNGLFEIERTVFNPLRPPKGATGGGRLVKLAVSDLFFATVSANKKAQYESILGAKLQTVPIQLDDIQHVDPGEVAVHKVRQAYQILKKPVFIDQSALSVRAWGGLPGGMTAAFIVPAGLSTLCRMMHPFEDKYAEAISVIAFTDGHLIRKFVGMLPGTITERPSEGGWSWNSIFVPDGFNKTLAEMTEEEYLSISSRRRATIEFMRFLQSTYEMV
ncbi:MAG: TIR domain-containing protein [Anaerolineae bacterium]|nr:TIR domain-containing protein [Anaerolineae bacterium]